MSHLLHWLIANICLYSLKSRCNIYTLIAFIDMFVLSICLNIVSSFYISRSKYNELKLHWIVYFLDSFMWCRIRLGWDKEKKKGGLLVLLKTQIHKPLIIIIIIIEEKALPSRPVLIIQYIINQNKKPLFLVPSSNLITSRVHVKKKWS
jgi:hypothetical protein